MSDWTESGARVSELPEDWGDGTRSVRAGEEPAVPGAPLRPSPVFAAPFHLGDRPPRAGGADAYARTDRVPSPQASALTRASLRGT